MLGKWAIPVIASILILGGMGLTQPTFASVVSPTFTDFGGHCYAPTLSGNWQATEDDAVLAGGHLVTINDVAENDFIFSLTGGGPWIGYNDIAVEGTFVWVSGIVTGYENWATGEPSGDSDFVHMQGDGTWNDLPDRVNVGIMELDDTCDVILGGAPIGGHLISIDTTDTTALLLAGAQSISMWMIPVVIAGIGIGLAVFTLRKK